ncbi:hypothetical protein MHYP_G00015610 [Metynnis hypsauchen]
MHLELLEAYKFQPPTSPLPSSSHPSAAAAVDPTDLQNCGFLTAFRFKGFHQRASALWWRRIRGSDLSGVLAALFSPSSTMTPLHSLHCVQRWRPTEVLQQQSDRVSEEHWRESCWRRTAVGGKMDYQKNRNRRLQRKERRRTDLLAEVKRFIQTLLRLRNPTASCTVSGKEREECDVRKEGERNKKKRIHSLNVLIDFCDKENREHRNLIQDCMDDRECRELTQDCVDDRE